MKTLTFAKTCQKEVSDQIGLIYPFQFKGFETISLNYDCILEEVENYWNQEARFREGFEFTDTTVTIPNFFTKITGVHKRKKEYKKYIEKFTQSKNSIIFNSVKDFEKSLNHITDITRNLPSEFASFNQIVSKYKYDNVKLNEVRFCNIPISLKPNFIKAYETVLSRTKNKDFKNNCFTLADKYLTLLNSFDYSKNVPKIIIMEQANEALTELDCLWLDFLNELCFDILIFAPTGNNDIETYLDINSFFLGIINENLKLEKKRISIEKGISFWKNCFLYFLFILPFISLFILIICYGLVFLKQVDFTFEFGLFTLLMSLVSIALPFKFDSKLDDFCKSKGLNFDYCCTGVLFHVIIFFILLVIMIMQYIDRNDHITQTYNGVLNIQNEVIEEDNYSLVSDTIFYLDEEKDEFLLGYIGNHPDNEKRLRAEIYIGKKRIFVTTLNPMQYILGEEIDTNLSKGEIKAKIKFIFYDMDEDFDESKLDKYDIFEKDIILKKCSNGDIPTEVKDRIENN